MFTGHLCNNILQKFNDQLQWSVVISVLKSEWQCSCTSSNLIDSTSTALAPSTRPNGAF